MDGLRIAFFGSSLVSAYWNGAATYYRGIVKALADRGHRVTFYEPDAWSRQEHRDIPDPDWAKVVVYEAEEDEVRRMLRRAREADVVVKASGVGVFDGLLEREVLELKSPDRKVIFWDVDAPATLDRTQRDPYDPFRPLVPEYDLVFTYGGGPPVVRAYEGLGARACAPIYNAVDPDTHHPVDPDSRFGADLAFLGNRMPDREERVREFLFLPAGYRPRRSFLVGGSGWTEDLPDLGNLRALGHVYTRDHNAFNSTPLAVLNVSRQSMADYGWSPATRVFEAAGAGACLITDEWEGVGEFLEPEVECLVAADGEAVTEHLDALDPARAAEMGRRARERVLADHTYADRAAEVEEQLAATPAVRAGGRR